MVAERMRAAIHPPARVPEKIPPARTELVTRPDGAKVTMTLAVPAGSPSWRQEDAEAAARLRAARAALASKDPLPELLLVETAALAPPLLGLVVVAAVFPPREDLLLLDVDETVELLGVPFLVVRALAPASAAETAFACEVELDLVSVAAEGWVFGAAEGCSFEGTL
jgi:hypothetical protein